MKLINLPASPFGRKVEVVIHELGLQDRVEVVNPGVVTPVSNNATLNDINPLGMLPALELDNGDSLYDSPVICEYLNTLAGGALYPADAEARTRALRLQALADGVLDLSVALRYELALRPENLRWLDWIEHQEEKVGRALDSLEQTCGSFAEEPTIGELTVACALGYRDFRFADVDWRGGHPALSAWYEGMAARDSFRNTIPA